MIDPQLVKSLYEQGYGTPFIAEKLGCSRWNVRYHLENLHIPMRSALEGKALYLTRQDLFTKEERKIAHRRQALEEAHRRRRAGKGLKNRQRKFIRIALRRMK